MYLPKTLELLRKFNREPLTGSDLLELCTLNGIELVLSPEPRRGYYYYADDAHTIVLSTRLNAFQRRLIGWHEFAHFLENYHEPREIKAYSNLCPSDASERLADVFALIAVDPDRIRITGGIDFIRTLMTRRLGSG